MEKNYRKVPIPDLRKKEEIINLKHINLYVCVIMAVIIVFLIFSIIWAASYPNSNVPAGI
ncbi:MAG: hypothetical protein FJ150_08835 [Euryarchaeota archaeon]|nr:hypothetical protein [Euryarchaeota archaeon]